MRTNPGKIYDTGAPGRGMPFYEGTRELHIGSHFNQCIMEEVSFDGISLRWCHCAIHHPITIEVESREEFVELHYNITGQSANHCSQGYLDLRPLSHTVFYSHGYDGSHRVTGDKNGAHTFMEIKLNKSVFDRLNQDMEGPVNIIMDYMANKKTGWVKKTAPVSPDMYFVIANIRNCPYSGSMKRLYMESKLMELYLLQINSLAASDLYATTKLKKADIEKIYEAKDFIDKYYGEACSIIGLSSYIGLNQQKLKTGFREVLGTTVFGYLSEVRMQEAKRMLIEEKKYVGEVACTVGYKNPHHFSAAFKRKFGLLPSELRE